MKVAIFRKGHEEAEKDNSSEMQRNEAEGQRQTETRAPVGREDDNERELLPRPGSWFLPHTLLSDIINYFLDPVPLGGRGKYVYSGETWQTPPQASDPSHIASAKLPDKMH